MFWSEKWKFGLGIKLGVTQLKWGSMTGAQVGGILVISGGPGVGAGSRGGLRLITRDNSHGRPRCWRAGKFSR